MMSLLDFDTTLKRFQQAIKASIKGSEFAHESVASLYYFFSENRHKKSRIIH